MYITYLFLFSTVIIYGLFNDVYRRMEGWLTTIE
jgi:hypothetical protein